MPEQPDDAALRAAIGDAMRGIIADVVIVNTAMSQELGLGPSDSQFLSLLNDHGALTAGELARRSGLSTGTVTGVIDRLERGGYVRRERHPSDRRKVVVTPVPEQLAAIGARYQGRADTLDRLLRARDPDELRTILHFLTDLAGDDH